MRRTRVDREDNRASGIGQPLDPKKDLRQGVRLDNSLGLKTAQGLLITEGYYWDKDDLSREFGKKFFARMNRMPTMNQASTYSATMHYLKAVKAAGTKDTKTVMAKMRELPVRDYFTQNGYLREDGRMVHSMLLLEVKKPEESKYPWDYYKVLAEVPGDQVFRPMKDGGCPLVAGK